MSTRALKKTVSLGQNSPDPDEMSQRRSSEHILVIDDDLAMQSLLADILQNVGYAVTKFSDTAGALKLITAGKRDVSTVICSLNMPRINGVELINLLQKMRIKVPVILIMEFGANSASKDILGTRAFGHLSKPFSLTDIHQLVQRAVQSRKP